MTNDPSPERARMLTACLRSDCDGNIPEMARRVNNHLHTAPGASVVSEQTVRRWLAGDPVAGRKYERAIKAALPSLDADAFGELC